MSILRCSGFRRYKAVRRPVCGCFACWFKFKFRRAKPSKNRRKVDHELVGPRGMCSKGTGLE